MTRQRQIVGASADTEVHLCALLCGGGAVRESPDWRRPGARVHLVIIYSSVAYLSLPGESQRKTGLVQVTEKIGDEEIKKKKN